MKTTRTRTAIRVYAHQLKVIGYDNTTAQGILHHTDGISMLWHMGCSAWLDRRPTEVFIDNGINEDSARRLLVVMLKAAIAERGLENKN